MTRALPEPLLSDDTIRLRRSLPGDVPAIDAGIHDEDVIRWIGPPEGSAAEVLALNERRWAAGSPTLSICDPLDRCVGLVWINVQDEDDTTGSVGYFLVPGARGRGMATTAVRLIARWAMDELGIERLRLVTESTNERSRRVAERTGFREAEVLHVPDPTTHAVTDHVVYELVAEHG